MSKFFKPGGSVFWRAETQLEDVRTDKPKHPGRRRKFGGSRMRDKRWPDAEQQATSDDSDKEEPSTSRPSRPTPSSSRSKAKSLALPKTSREPEGKIKKFHSTKESSNVRNVQMEAEGVKSVMEDVARGLLDRLPKVEQLEATAVNLEQESQSFQKETNKLESKMKEQNRRMTKILIIVVGVGALIVVPIVIYLAVRHDRHDK